MNNEVGVGRIIVVYENGRTEEIENGVFAQISGNMVRVIRFGETTAEGIKRAAEGVSHLSCHEILLRIT